MMLLRFRKQGRRKVFAGKVGTTNSRSEVESDSGQNIQTEMSPSGAISTSSACDITMVNWMIQYTDLDQERHNFMSNDRSMSLESRHAADVQQRPTGIARSEPSSVHDQADDLALERLIERANLMFEELKEDFRSTITTIQKDRRQIAILEQKLQKTQSQLQTHDTERLLVRKKWKKASSELNKARLTSFGRLRFTDGDLIDAVNQLRYDIRAFSAQYFTGAMQKSSTLSHGENLYLWKYMLEATSEPAIYLMSDTAASSLVQSFLWRVIVGEIFEKFCWIPQLRGYVTGIYDSIRSGKWLSQAEYIFPHSLLTSLSH